MRDQPQRPLSEQDRLVERFLAHHLGDDPGRPSEERPVLRDLLPSGLLDPRPLWERRQKVQTIAGFE